VERKLQACLSSGEGSPATEPVRSLTMTGGHLPLACWSCSALNWCATTRALLTFGMPGFEKQFSRYPSSTAGSDSPTNTAGRKN
jgi:hypothetical protein